MLASLPVPFVVGGAVNAYVLVGPPHAVVDPGPDTPAARAALEAALADRGLSVTDLDLVLVTHTHVDHAGGAAALAAAAGAPVAAHPAAASTFRDWAAAWAARTSHYERAARAGGVPGDLLAAFLHAAGPRARYGSSDAAVSFRALDPGASVRAGGRTWRVLHTPGHAVDHVAFYATESGTLISGDLLLRHLSTIAFLDPRRAGTSQQPALADLVASWRALGRLGVAVAWPGHGAPIRAHRILIARRLATTRARLRTARAAVVGGAETVWEVATALELSPAPEHLAATISDTASLLEWLVDRHLLVRARAGEVVRYAAPPT